jgi:heptosyltransferase II
VEFSRILVRAANWLGDAVMSLPALRALRERFPGAFIAVQARPWVADLYARERFLDCLIPYASARGASDWGGKWRAAQALRAEHFDCALLLPNSLDSALVAWLAGIPRRIGYNRDRRRLLLTDAIQPPMPGEIPRHERFYYLELLRRSGIVSGAPVSDAIHLDCGDPARQAGEARFQEFGLAAPVIGVSPGAAYGGAKRWLPERFAETASRLAASLGASVAVFGSKDERAIAEAVAEQLRASHILVRNSAGETTLREFIDLAAACRVFITNDSGAMHLAAALGVPTVAVFGATDHEGTGPTGPLVKVVREPVECSPCLLRECPIDHRCMTRVSVGRVAQAALDLLK